MVVGNCDGRGHRKRREGERKGEGVGGGGGRGVHAATKVRVKVRNTATKWYYPRRFHYVTTTTDQSKTRKWNPLNQWTHLTSSVTPRLSHTIPPVTAFLFSQPKTNNTFWTYNLFSPSGHLAPVKPIVHHSSSHSVNTLMAPAGFRGSLVTPARGVQVAGSGWGRREWILIMGSIGDNGMEGRRL